MPRPSAISLATRPTVDVRQLRLQPGPELTPSQARVFTELVGSKEPAHFRECDRPLLNQAVRAIELADELARALDGAPLLVPGRDGLRANPLIPTQREQARLVASLLTRLRLTPQARMSRDKAAKTTPDDGANLTRALHLARSHAQ